MKKICDGLNEAGQRTIKGNKFSVNSLRTILANRAYIGEYKFGDVIIPDGMPLLIDNATFQEAQAKLEANRRGGKGAVKKIHPDAPIEDYWLSGKLYCGLCGGAVQGMSGTSKGGRSYYYYSCGNHRKHKCALKSQRKGLLEKIVLFTLEDFINDPTLRILLAQRCYAYYEAQNNDNGAYEASLKAQLKDVEGKLNNLLKAVEAGIFNSTTAERMNVLENQKSMLNDALLAEQNRMKYGLTLKSIAKYLNSVVGDVNNPETRRQLLEFFVDKIYVYPDKMAITFFYSDDRQELPFEETEAFIDNQQRLLDMVLTPNPAPPPDISSRGILFPFEYDRGDEDEDEEENSDFFT